MISYIEAAQGIGILLAMCAGIILFFVAIAVALSLSAVAFFAIFNFFQKKTSP